VRPWGPTMRRELIRHVLILVGIVVLVVVLRLVVGETRATASAGSAADLVPRMVGSLVVGPLGSLAATVYQPLRALPSWSLETALVALVVFAVAGLLLWRIRPEKAAWPGVLQVCTAGLAMLVLGYGLAFTHYPPNAIVGRGTSVHLGATLGTAVLASAVAWAVLSFKPRLGSAVIGAYLAIAAGYYVSIERDFVLGWQVQRQFWQQVAACCSDLQDGTVVLYELDPASIPTTFIFTNSGADALGLRELYRFPSDWQNPPRLFSLTEWQPRVVAAGQMLEWWVPGATWDEHWEELPQDNVILLRLVNGNLVRARG